MISIGMNTPDQRLRLPDEDEIKLSLIDDDANARKPVVERLWLAFREPLMRSLGQNHPLLTLEDHADMAYDAVAKYCGDFRSRKDWENKPIYMVMARIAINLGRDRYKKVSLRWTREVDTVAAEVAEVVANTKCGEAWHAADKSTRAKISQIIRDEAAKMKPRQRQVASAFTLNWHKELTAKEARDFIFEQTGELLSLDQYKRALAEVRSKLGAPILQLLKDEGYAP